MSTPIAQNTTSLEELLEIAASLPEAVEPAVLQSKSVTPTKSAQTVKPDTGYDGLSEVTVDAIPSKYIEPSGTKSITANGTHDVTSYASASVNVSAKVQEKSVTPTTSAQTVTPDSGYDGLSKVSVGAVKTATQATPSISVSSSGLITASATQTAGYVSAGTKSATQQMTTQAAQTITPGTSNQTIAVGRYLTGIQTILGDSNLIADNIKSGVSIFGVLGSLPSGAQIKTGTYTPASNTSGGSTVKLSHNAGFIPRIFVMYRNAGTVPSLDHALTFFAKYLTDPTNGRGAACATDGRSSTSKNCGGFATISLSGSNSSFKDTITQTTFWGANNGSQDTYLKSGDTYTWIAVSDWEGNF